MIPEDEHVDYHSAYEPPRAPKPPATLNAGDPPPVLFWYRVYCWVMVVIYLIVGAIGVGLIMTADQIAAMDDDTDSLELTIQGVVFAVMGVPLTIFFIAAALLRGRAGWIVGIVSIAFGLTSCCSIPAAIPLLIYWLKPETKAFFYASTKVARQGRAN